MPTLTPVIVFGLIATGASARLDEGVAPKFSIGDTVEMKNINPVTRTCLPRYVRGKKGIVGKGPRRVCLPRHRRPRPRPQGAICQFYKIFISRALGRRPCREHVSLYRHVRRLYEAGNMNDPIKGSDLKRTPICPMTEVAQCSTRRGRPKPLPI